MSSCPESQYHDIEVALTPFIGVCSAWKQKRPRSPSGTNGRRVRRNSYKRRGVEISQQYLVVNGTGQRLKINYWCCSSSRPGVSSTSAACMVGLVNSMSITVIVITVNYSELQGGEICDLCCRLGPPCYTRTRHRAPGGNQYRRAARAASAHVSVRRTPHHPKSAPRLNNYTQGGRSHDRDNHRGGDTIALQGSQPLCNLLCNCNYRILH